MGEITRIEQAVLSMLFLAGLGLGLWKMRQITTQVKQSQVRNADGSLRQLTASERFTLANYLAHQRGKYFWHVIIAGILLIGLVLFVLWITGIVPVQ